MQLASFLDHLSWSYDSGTGSFSLDHIQDGRALVARGYSGKGSARNQPDREREKATGPIPRGLWRLGTAVSHPTLGPVAIPLSYVSKDGQQSAGPFGRSGFYIHGDNSRGDGSASTGCIVLSRPVRDFIAGSVIRTLVVE